MAETDPSVRVSVIMPVRNEAGCIKETIRSVLDQEEPEGGFELIVVDGQSDDGTRQVLVELAESSVCIPMRLIDNPRRITPVGFNLGIRSAKGQIIILMGAHNTYAKDYILQCVRKLEETGADNVGGAMQAHGEGLVQQAIAVAHHCWFAVGGARWHNASYEGPADTVFGGAYRRSVFDQIGLFDEELVRNQDDELNLRLIRSGGRIWHSPAIRSRYSPRNSLFHLWRQYFQYGYWKVRVIQKHRMPASVRHFVPGGFVLTLLVLAALTCLGGALSLALETAWIWHAFSVSGRALGLVLSVYLVAAVFAAIGCGTRHGWSVVLLLPLVFACYHFAYGIGFLRGVFDFMIRREGQATICSSLSR